MAARSSTRKSPPPKAPPRRTNHGDNIASTIARIAVSLAGSPRDVTTQMAIVKETFSERAAIREYVGSMHRETAENMAIRDACEVLGLRYEET